MAMASDSDLLKRAKLRLDRLAPERRRAADDFLAYLEERESDEATVELLVVPGFRQALEQAEKEIEEGELTPAAALRSSSMRCSRSS